MFALATAKSPFFFVLYNFLHSGPNTDSVCLYANTCPLNKALTQHEGKDVYRVGHPKLFGATIIQLSESHLT